MSNRSLAKLAVASLALAYAPGYAPAQADAPASTGVLCEFAPITDPLGEPDTRTGVLSGGPILMTGEDGVTPETGTLVCRVQVNIVDHNGSGPTVSGHGTGLLTAGPGTVSVEVGPDDSVFLCGEFLDDSDGMTYYWDAELGEWSTDSGVACANVPLLGDEDDPYNRTWCPLLGQLPSPLAEDLQAAWGDCAGSGPNAAIAVVNGAVITPSPAWGCSPVQQNGNGGGSVTCSPPGMNSLTVCKEVFPVAAATYDPNSWPTKTVKGRTACIGLERSVVARDNAAPAVASWSKPGYGSLPVTCEWGPEAWTTLPADWAVVCGWNLGV